MNFSRDQTTSKYRSRHSQMFFKIEVLKNFTMFTGKHLCWSLCLVKLQSSGLPLYQKKTPVQVVFSKYCKIIKNRFFYKTLLVAFSKIGRKSPATEDNKLITNNNLRSQQPQRATTNYRYKGI